MKIYTYFLLLIIFISSCVTNKEVTFLQSKDELKSTPLYDTVLREYDYVRVEYKLQVDDRLDIKIPSLTPEEYNPFAVNDPSFLAVSPISGQTKVAMGYSIKSDGTLNLPIVGEINAEGKTIDQLEDTVQSLVKNYLKDPVVKISLLNYNYYILSDGATVNITLDESYVTIIEAVAKAGITNEFVDWSKVKIIRHIDGKSKIFYLNLLDEDIFSSDHYYLFPNDIIVLAPLKKRTYMKYFGKNVSQISTVVSSILSLLALSVAVSNMGN